MPSITYDTVDTPVSPGALPRAQGASFTPAVAAYWQRLRARPGFASAMAAQEAAATEQGVSPVPAPDCAPNLKP